MNDLSDVTHPWFALIALTFIAYVPGFMNAFLLFSLLFDRRPRREAQAFYPGVTILIAAYQEEAAIGRHRLNRMACDGRGGVRRPVVKDDHLHFSGVIFRRDTFQRARSRRMQRSA